jgi:polar amino acid transport system permease protein
MVALSNFLSDFVAFSPIFAASALYTVSLWLISLSIATALGLILASIEWLQIRAISRTVRYYIIAMGGVPVLVQLLYWFFFLPYLGIELSAFWAAGVGLGFAFCIYMAEVFRAGILTIENGQIEAAASFSMKRHQIVRRVVLPQAAVTSLPGYSNIAVLMLKATSLASVIAVPELSRTANLLTQTTFKSFTIYTMLAVYYLCISVPLVIAVRSLEQWARRR